ncbi:MAG: polysaccharide biosynthesis/export family protein [Opitutus sp.]|nr:polysaccharide biosynthesis/export family protein [Opitutus sp.]
MNSVSRFRTLAGLAALAAGLAFPCLAEEPATPPSSASLPNAITDPDYEIAPGDSVGVSVYAEPDLGATQRLDSKGNIRLPLLGDVPLAGKTVRDAENTLERLYREREFLREPLVSIVVSGFAVREVSVLGAVRAPGNFRFPSETTSIDIVDLITRLGGFQPTAKSDMVKVTRRSADGKETIMTVDVESMISGRNNSRQRQFAILPGDRVWVPERLF